MLSPLLRMLQTTRHDPANPCRGAELSPADRFYAVLGAATGIPGLKILGIAANTFGHGLDAFRKLARLGKPIGESSKFVEIIADSAKKFEVPPTKLGEYMGRLRDAGRTKGNFDLPTGTKSEANFLGESWVGPDARKFLIRVSQISLYI